MASVRAVVHHDELEIRERLAKHARERPGDPGGSVTDAHQDGHRGRGHYRATAPRRASTASTAAQ